jgi:hypothetical protein
LNVWMLRSAMLARCCLQQWKRSSELKNSIFNTARPDNVVLTLQNEAFRRSKITSYRHWLLQTPRSRSNYGISSSHRSNSVTFFHTSQILIYQRTQAGTHGGSDNFRARRLPFVSILSSQRTTSTHLPSVLFLATSFPTKTVALLLLKTETLLSSTVYIDISLKATALHALLSLIRNSPLSIRLIRCRGSPTDTGASL